VPEKGTVENLMCNMTMKVEKCTRITETEGEIPGKNWLREWVRGNMSRGKCPPPAVAPLTSRLPTPEDCYDAHC